MKTLMGMALAFCLSACGVETATTAATVADLKKQEIEQGKKTMEQFQQKLDQTNQQVAQRAERAAEAEK